MSETKEPPNAKKAQLAAEALGFECFTFVANVHKDATLWVGDGVSAAGEAHKDGDVRYAEKDIDGWFLRGRHQALPTELAFELVYADGFHTARVIDPVGKEVELRVDYSYGKKEAENYGYLPEYAEKMLQERDYRYNDGETYNLTRWRMQTWGEFSKWIDDMIDVFKVDHKKISTVRKPKAAKTEEDVMYELLNPKVDYSL